MLYDGATSHGTLLRQLFDFGNVLAGAGDHRGPSILLVFTEGPSEVFNHFVIDDVCDQEFRPRPRGQAYGGACGL